ncbi:MAG: DUF4982 domain-containing protein [Candidatus Didemnitutus sp.]|nr:DUF4982 domain-containing protein [Candidatus Didemnitutus sp.]
MSLRRTVVLAFALCAAIAFAAEPRREWPLADGWRTAMDETNRARYDGFEQPAFDDSAWQTVSVPHNWDDYGGLRRTVHGNLHGYAWYRRSFAVPASEQGRRVFLFFEGVGSYATVWMNGQLAGRHAGGRTTFTLEVTDLVRFDAPNLLAVRADHPAGITDLPWVCGGCSPQPGFSEGSQPMGIFRPVTLLTTGDIRVAPFGVHVWNDETATAASATLHYTIELNGRFPTRSLVVENRVLDAQGKILVTHQAPVRFPGESMTLRNSLPLGYVTLWSPDQPYLYTLETTVLEDGNRLVDRVETPFGIRTIHWPAPDAPLPAAFLLNGQPVFINGTCEYEHNLGASHAFIAEQIAARVAQIRAAGFNAFRDAHQPHNLRYQDYWDREGLLWWPQMAAQVWFDTPEFRANFKQLLREWVRERRNSPSLVLWGLANESKLPADFAAECVAIIRELDPTTPSQRLVTTCNAGKGTDWNVPQNWSGTYGGKPEDYAEDLKRQRLVGEYGAWRSLGLHSEGGFIADGPRSESRADALLATKIRLAESVRAEVPGHFHWLFATHENPGRTIGSKGQQGTDGWAELDRLGPANNKGLLTLWGEPTDAFYLFRASYAPPSDPMVYIVSHTWPDRWDAPGVKDGIEVYSNCDEVELFNDAGGRESLGVRRNGGRGVPFRWDGVNVRNSVLAAEGRIGGQVVARDAIVLHHLPAAPHQAELLGATADLTAPEPGQNYLYRVNCGGPDYTDRHGALWQADDGSVSRPGWQSYSWAIGYEDLPNRFGSLRVSSEIVRGTEEQALFQTYRYGREKLSYVFAVPEGDYRLELYFMEPAYGLGGGDCTGWRLFDVAVNGTTLLRDVDLWREAGPTHAVRKVVHARAKDGCLVVSFPRVASYQAVISALAVSTSDPKAQVPQEVLELFHAPKPASAQVSPALDTAPQRLPVSAAQRTGQLWTWSVPLGLGGAHDFAFDYIATAPADVELQVHAADGSIVASRRFVLPSGAGSASLEGAGMNAGDYRVTLQVLSGALTPDALKVK